MLGPTSTCAKNTAEGKQRLFIYLFIFISNSETFRRNFSLSLGECKYFGPNFVLIFAHTACICFDAVH